MSAFLLYHRKTKPTGRALANALGILHGADPALIPLHVTTVIRWGNAKRIPRGDVRVINEARSIMLAGDKLESIKRFQEAGVPTLQYREAPPDDGTWFCRKRRGFGGKDISILQYNPLNPGEPFVFSNAGIRLHGAAALDAVENADFFTRWVDNSREYRIHVVDGEIIRFQRKYYEGDQPQSVVRVQNHSNGYVFKQPERRLNADRFEAAKGAVAALELDFGAVDLLVDTSLHGGGKPVVLEVNTAASCAPKTLEAYTTAFSNLLEV